MLYQVFTLAGWATFRSRTQPRDDQDRETGLTDALGCFAVEVRHSLAALPIREYAVAVAAIRGVNSAALEKNWRSPTTCEKQYSLFIPTESL